MPATLLHIRDRVAECCQRRAHSQLPRRSVPDRPQRPNGSIIKKTRGWNAMGVFIPSRPTPFLPPTLIDLPECPPALTRIGSQHWRDDMQKLSNTSDAAPAQGGLLGGWISRRALADELGVTEDTLRRWDAARSGPPCIRAGRKIFYRRSAVLDWLEEQDTRAPRGRGRRQGRGGRR
jgi:hypothetical protein